MTVLLIAEDDDDIRAVLERIFRRTGFSVLVAADGRQALRMAVEARPELILTDLDMPGLTGLELCRAVRAEPALNEVPVALISGSLTPGDPRAVEAQACAVVLKPFTGPLLVTEIESLVRAGRHPHPDIGSRCPLAAARVTAAPRPGPVRPAGEGDEQITTTFVAAAGRSNPAQWRCGGAARRG
ncbi:hypothetical protein GCM10020358_81240 [Amorphoplanes nipponensis]|uniref:Response regulatory domain-containing protein n=1 Tax=Actinoplanes nipponensis TaxID=135950 RepID=A0A919JBJ7_9ACTN|nr:response regulator [Actinoplanes nipponensis]GIE47683.1 hypothetical protein Ani05nite_12170 [Actinoplanes nipponensis]